MNQKLIKVFEFIGQLDKDFNKYVDINFVPPMTTFNIGMARTFSDNILLVGCVNWPPVVTEKIYMEWMEKLRDQCKSVGALFRIRDFKLPFVTETSSDFCKTVFKSIGEVASPPKWLTQPVTSELTFLVNMDVKLLFLARVSVKKTAMLPMNPLR